MSPIGMKSTRARDWKAAWSFVAGAPCVVCGTRKGITPMHLWPRSRGGDESENNIAAGCAGPGTPGDHTAFDNGELDLGPYLTSAQRIRVVELAEAHNPGGGLNAAHRRLYPSLHKERT